MPTPAPLRETRELVAHQQLSEQQRADLDRGQHLDVAQALQQAGQVALAAWVHEQIWDFERAATLYREVRHYLDALRCGLMSRDDGLLARIVDDIESDPDLRAQELKALAQWLSDRRRPEHAATLWSQLKQASGPLAAALGESGDHLSACRTLLDGQDPAAALDLIEQRPQDTRPAPYDALAARAHWELGDVEQCAYLAQRAMNKGLRDSALLKLLACALVSLSYPIGAETLLGELPGTAGALGRYRATGILPASFAGVAYSAMDRRHLEEVEVHLLLGDRSQARGQAEPTMERFAAIARSASSIGHPAIRTIIALDPRTGTMVLPRAQGGVLADLIRPPGLGTTPSRVVAIVLRMAKALQAAQAHGFNHGSLLPSQIVTDAAGRPVLGPFGAQLLSGFTATRTAALDELIHFTAPEHRVDRGASEAGDVYALGRIFIALWTGRVGESVRAEELESLPAVIRRAASQHVDPRPSLQVLRDALKELRFDVGALTQHARLGANLRLAPSQAPDPERAPQARAGIRIDCHPSCSTALLDALCAQSPALCQSILDRDGRRIWLAPWPSGTRRHDDGTSPNAPELRTEELDPALQDEFASRIDPSDWVELPSGETMLELVGLLSRE